MSFVTQSSCICHASVKWGMGAQNWSVTGSRPAISHDRVRGGERPQLRRPAEQGGKRGFRFVDQPLLAPAVHLSAHWRDERFELVLAAAAEGVEVPDQVLRRLSILGRLADRRSARAAPGRLSPARKSGCCRRRRLSCRAANCAMSVECRRHDPHAPGRTVRTYLLHDLALIEVVMRGPCLFHANA